MNALADKLANEGVDKEGPKLDEAWTRIPSGKLRTDYNHLATKYCDGSFRSDSHIKEDNARLLGRTWDPGRV
jgi:hypothetical protein